MRHLSRGPVEASIFLRIRECYGMILWPRMCMARHRWQCVVEMATLCNALSQTPSASRAFGVVIENRNRQT